MEPITGRKRGAAAVRASGGVATGGRSNGTDTRGFPARGNDARRREEGKQGGKRDARRDAKCRTVRNVAGGAIYDHPARVLAPGERLIPQLAGAAIRTAGICREIDSKLSPGRSSGRLPAHRAVVAHGACRHVRHPIHLGDFRRYPGVLPVNPAGGAASSAPGRSSCRSRGSSSRRTC
ncbi:hypothetical protein [Burkholderia perseverans]|uniref:hypothetical protein n=1 Tax=Burkholderia perseverans TaxID=2615214 RepID=UPI001FEE0FA1|nr:hypothetical protein [Burkholderia perseverans]